MPAVVAVQSDDDDARNAMVERLLASHLHRGDASQRYRSENVVLAAASSGVSCGPFARERLVVVADARIDNRTELAARLGVADDTTVAELFLRAHLAWNVDWPAHVIGDFAAIIWDAPARELHLIRDAVGVRCLYWARDRRGIRCASEPRPVAATLSHPLSANVLQMALFLENEYDERGETLWAGVRSVPPAHVVTLASGLERSHRYWQAMGRPQTTSSRDQCADEFRGVFREAVRARVVDVGRRVAIDVSGGQDSTAVAAMAGSILTADAGAKPLAVTLTFPGLACDESSYSRAFTDHLALDCLEIDPLEAPELLSVDFEPHRRGDVYFNPTIAFKWLQLRRARALGAHVTLTGLGSDQIAHREPIAETADALRRGPRGLLANLSEYGLGQVCRAFVHTMTSHRFRRRIRRTLHGKQSLLRASLARDVDDVLVSRVEALEALPHRDRTQVLLARCLEHDLTLPLASLDRMAAREKAEFRHPFLDRRVIETLFAMPQAVVAGSGSEFRKPLLRQAMQDLVPDSIRARRSVTNFNSFIVRVLFECGFDPGHLLRNGRVRQYRLLDDAMVMELLRDPTSNANLRRLTNWLALEIWLHSLESSGDIDGQDA